MKKMLLMCFCVVLKLGRNEIIKETEPGNWSSLNKKKTRRNTLRVSLSYLRPLRHQCIATETTNPGV